MEEIEYYTGLNMEDTEVFETIIDKMNEKFKDVAKEYSSLDSYYETNQNFIEYIEKELNNWLKESKETEKDYEESNNELLEESSNNEIVNKSIELSPLEKYERYWVLAAKVIKIVRRLKRLNLE